MGFLPKQVEKKSALKINSRQKKNKERMIVKKNLFRFVVVPQQSHAQI
jgi:hypothetical protein